MCGICPEKVKTSFEKNDSGRIFRWFVIHDSEEVLSTLDTKWQQIQIHTSWKLEPCYSSKSSPAQTPLVNLDDATANQSTVADNTQTSDAKFMVQLSPNEDEQATSHSPSRVSDSNSPADILSGEHFLAQPTLVAT